MSSESNTSQSTDPDAFQIMITATERGKKKIKKEITTNKSDTKDTVFVW
jgi:hypothetical protein